MYLTHCFLFKFFIWYILCISIIKTCNLEGGPFCQALLSEVDILNKDYYNYNLLLLEKINRYTVNEAIGQRNI